MHNIEIRTKIKESRLYNYEIAQKLGVTEFTFCRWLRDELPEEKKTLILDTINEILGGVKA